MIIHTNIISTATIIHTTIALLEYAACMHFFDDMHLTGKNKFHEAANGTEFAIPRVLPSCIVRLGVAIDCIGTHTQMFSFVAFARQRAASE